MVLADEITGTFQIVQSSKISIQRVSVTSEGEPRAGGAEANIRHWQKASSRERMGTPSNLLLAVFETLIDVVRVGA